MNRQEGVEGGLGGAQRIFRVVKLLVMIPQWCTRVITHLFKSTEEETPRGNSNINHGLWVITMHWRRFISCNKSTAPVESAGHRGRLYKWGTWGYMRNLWMSPQVGCQPNSCSKKSSLLKKKNVSNHVNFEHKMWDLNSFLCYGQC